MNSDDTVFADPQELDSAPEGKELTRGDYLVLGVLGLLLPAGLLVWGWF